MNTAKWDARQPSFVPGPTMPGAAQSCAVGIGELAVSADRGLVIAAHALGSCVAVCIWDPAARVGGIQHCLLPDSRINAARAAAQPATFADTGIPLLFESARRLGLQKSRTLVYLVGGAEGQENGGVFDVGKRNILTVRSMCWKLGVLVTGESVGGTTVRTVRLAVGDGHVVVTSGRECVAEW